MSLLCVCGLGLAACGRKSDSGVDSGGAVEEVVVDPSEKFLGSWELAAMEFQNITVVGDISSVVGLVDEEMGEASESGKLMVFEFKDDKTGVVTFAGDTATFTWELADDTSSVKFMGEDCSLTESDGGICIDIVIAQLPFKMVGDYLVVDLSPLMDAEIALIYAK